MIIETRSAKETYDLGKKIGSHAKAGEVYTLVGDLGVGKYLPRDWQKDWGLKNRSAVQPLQ